MNITNTLLFLVMKCENPLQCNVKRRLNATGTQRGCRARATCMRCEHSGSIVRAHGFDNKNIFRIRWNAVCKLRCIVLAKGALLQVFFFNIADFPCDLAALRQLKNAVKKKDC